MDILAYFGLIFAIVFIPLGLFMLSGRGKMLIAGYNTMSAEERAKAEATYDMDKMTRIIGIMLILIGLSAAIWRYTDPMLGAVIFTLSIIIPLVILIIGQFTFLRKDR
jgi:hypothetical protein